MATTPVLIFCYKRRSSLEKLINSLRKDALASDTEVFIFSDGARCAKDDENVNEVREYLTTLSGFKNIHLSLSSSNKGLSRSIIDGVTTAFLKAERVIVLEDDLVVSDNFLDFMNSALLHYEHRKDVYSISGYTPSLKAALTSNNDVYFTKRASSWGWATWKDRWEGVDWNVSDYQQFKIDKAKRRVFNRMGSDMSAMLDKQMQGSINSWAIRWCYHQYKHDLYSVFPTASKVKNVGFGEGATHTFDRFNRFETELDTTGKKDFNFIEPSLDKKILKHFTSKYSLYTRAKYKVLNTLAAAIRK